jgi:hypothetical protein
MSNKRAGNLRGGRRCQPSASTFGHIRVEHYNNAEKQGAAAAEVHAGLHR